MFAKKHMKLVNIPEQIVLEEISFLCRLQQKEDCKIQLTVQLEGFLKFLPAFAQVGRDCIFNLVYPQRVFSAPPNFYETNIFYSGNLCIILTPLKKSVCSYTCLLMETIGSYLPTKIALYFLT